MKQLRRCRWLASLALAAILCGCYTTYSVPFRGEQKNVEKRHLADAPPDVSVDNLRVNYDAHPPEIACSLGGKMEESWEERPVFEAVHTRHGRMYGDVAVFQNVKKLHESYRPFQITRWFWGHDYEFWATTKGGAYPLFPLTRAHRAAVDPAAALKGFGSFPIASSVWEGKKHLFPVMGDGDLESPVFPMTVSNEWVNSIGQLFMDIIGAACTIGIGVLTTISGAANGDPTAKKALLAPFAMILCPVADVGIHVGDFALFAVAGIHRLPGGRRDQVAQLVGLLVVGVHAHQDVRHLNAPRVVELIPIVGGRNNRSVQIRAHVDALPAAEGDEIGDKVRLRAGFDRAHGDRDIAAHPERVRQQPADTLLRHHQCNDLRYPDAGLKSDARRGKRVERRPRPTAALRVAYEDDRPSR